MQRDWFDTGLRTIGMYLDGRSLRHRDRRGQPVVDDSFLLLLHSGDADRGFVLPAEPWAHGDCRRAARRGQSRMAHPR